MRKRVGQLSKVKLYLLQKVILVAKLIYVYVYWVDYWNSDFHKLLWRLPWSLPILNLIFVYITVLEYFVIALVRFKVILIKYKYLF